MAERADHSNHEPTADPVTLDPTCASIEAAESELRSAVVDQWFRAFDNWASELHLRINLLTGQLRAAETDLKNLEITRATLGQLIMSSGDASSYSDGRTPPGGPVVLPAPPTKPTETADWPPAYPQNYVGYPLAHWAPAPSPYPPPGYPPQPHPSAPDFPRGTPA